MNIQYKTLLALFILVIFNSTTAQADNYYQSLIDSDGDVSTGCLTSTIDRSGVPQSFQGADWAIKTTVDSNSNLKTQETLRCSGSAWSKSDTINFSGGLKLQDSSVEQAASGMQLVDGFRVGFMASGTSAFSSADVLFSSLPATINTGTPAPSSSGPNAIPSTGILSLAFLAVILLVASKKRLKRGFVASCMVIIGIGLTDVGYTLSTIVVDGKVNDWIGVQVHEQDSELDASRQDLDITQVFISAYETSIALRMDLSTLSDNETTGSNGEPLVHEQITGLKILSASVSQPNDIGIVSVTGSIDLIAGNAGKVNITNQTSGDWFVVKIDGSGNYLAELAAKAGNIIQMFPINSANKPGQIMSVVVQGSKSEPEVAIDPVSVAPLLKRNQINTLFDQIEFLYTGANKVQHGVTPGTIEPKRTSVLVGKVLNRDNTSLAGVSVSVEGHEKYGYTLSQDDGDWDLVVNGGQSFTINFKKEGYLPVQRKVDANWQAYGYLPNVVMIPLDTKVSFIDLTDQSQEYQRHQSSEYEDADGKRKTTVLFPKGLQATLVMPDGSEEAIQRLNVRATEYTVGENGPQAMPGDLPPASAYTFATELSIDQAIAVGAKTVKFDRPVPFYVDNFLDFPSGSIVPVGFYDSSLAAWVPQDDGLVIKVLGLDSGKAQIDVNGGGVPATQLELTELGITEAELIEITELYAINKSFWRVTVTHFSPWDCNWPYEPPSEESQPPEDDEDEGKEDEDKEDEEEETEEEKEDCLDGCVIHVSNREVSESVSITGSEFSLHYKTSEQHDSRQISQSLKARLTTANLPSAEVVKIKVKIEIAGRVFENSFSRDELTPNLIENYEWDGKDRYGRALKVCQRALQTKTYEAQLRYNTTSRLQSTWRRSFGLFAQAGLTVSRPGSTGLVQINKITIKNLCPSSTSNVHTEKSNLGGWTITPYHHYDPITRTLLKGDGQKVSISNSIDQGTEKLTGARDKLAGLFSATPEGDYLSLIDNAIYRIDQISGDTELLYASSNDITVAKRFSSGDIYFSSGSQLFKLDNGDATKVAGNSVGVGGGADDVNGANANDHGFHSIRDFVSTRSGGILILDDNSLKKIMPDNSVYTIVPAAGGSNGLGDGGRSINAGFSDPSSLVVDKYDNIYIADEGDYRVRKINSAGVISTYAGNGNQPAITEDPAASEHVDASVLPMQPTTLGFDVSGNLLVGQVYESNSNNSTIRKVLRDKSTITAAGFYSKDQTQTRPNTNIFGAFNTQLANEGFVPLPSGDIAVNILKSDGKAQLAHIEKIAGYDEQYINLPSSDGRKVFEFDSIGNHLRTIDALTGATIYTFSHDSDGKLTKIIDYDGLVTSITHSEVTSAFGQKTKLTYTSSGMLATITNPANEEHSITYDGRLMSSFSLPDGNTNYLSYTESGKLKSDTWANGGGWNIEFESNSSPTNIDQTVTMVSAEGRRTSHTVKKPTRKNNWRSKTIKTNYPDGTKKTTNISKGSSVSIAYPNGDYESANLTADPRFGSLAEYQSSYRIDTPRTASYSETVQRLVDIEDGKQFPARSFQENRTVNGNTWQRRFQTDLLQWEMQSPLGRTSTLAVDGLQRPLSVKAHDLATGQFSYTPSGQLKTFVLQDSASGARRSWSRNYYLSGASAGYLKSITDAYSQTTSYEYDLAGRITSETIADGRKTLYDYFSDGRIKSITPPGRDAHHFKYTQANDGSAYLPPSLVGGETDTLYEYNLDRQLKRIQLPDGGIVGYNYDAAKGRLNTISSPDRNYSYAYDAVTGQFRSKQDDSGNSIAAGWDGKLLESVSFNGDIDAVLTWKYDRLFRERESSIRDSLDRAYKQTFKYNDDGQLLSTNDLNLTWKNENGLLKSTNYQEITSSNTYNAFADVTEMSVHYQSVSLSVEATHLTVANNQLQLSATNLPAAVKYIRINDSRYNINDQGQPVGAVSLNMGDNLLQISYLDENEQPLSNIVAKTIELVAEESSKPTVGQFYRHTNDYLYYSDENNNLLRYEIASNITQAVPQPGLNMSGTRIGVDAAGQAYYLDYTSKTLRVFSQNGLLWQVNIDSNNFETPVVTATGDVFYFNFQGRTLYKLSSQGSEVFTEFDTNEMIGSLTGDGESSVLVGVVERGMPDCEADSIYYPYCLEPNFCDEGAPICDQVANFERVYQLDGSQTKTKLYEIKVTGSAEVLSLMGVNNGLLCYKNGGYQTFCLYQQSDGSYNRYSVGYDMRDGQTTGSDKVVYFHRDGANVTLRETVRPGVDDIHQDLLAGQSAFNVTGTLMFSSSASSELLLYQTQYTRDDGGRITEIDETRGMNTHNYAYEYNNVGKLVKATLDGNVTTWSYDANGNRSHENEVEVARYDEQDRLLQYKDNHYNYNKLGQLTEKANVGGKTDYVYDVWGNLRKLTMPSGDVIDYQIDPAQRRVGKKINDVVQRQWVYKDQINPVAELYPSGALKHNFIYSEYSHVPSAMESYGEDGLLIGKYRIVSNHLGSVTRVIKADTGEVVQDVMYDAWGNVLQDSNPGFQPFYFAGGIYDRDSKLTRFGARDYDAEVGRWTAKDPIGFSGGLTSLYDYVGGDPVTFIDITGRAPLHPSGKNGLPGGTLGPGAKPSPPAKPNLREKIILTGARQVGKRALDLALPGSGQLGFTNPYLAALLAAVYSSKIGGCDENGVCSDSLYREEDEFIEKQYDPCEKLPVYK